MLPWPNEIYKYNFFSTLRTFVIWEMDEDAASADIICLSAVLLICVV